MAPGLAGTLSQGVPVLMLDPAARGVTCVPVAGGHAYLRSPEGAEFDGTRPAVACIGTFDGLHRGHQELVDAACASARTRGRGCLAVAVTFDPPPSEFLAPDVPACRLLQTPDRAAALLARGLDAVIVLAFDDSLAQQPYEAFLDDVLGSLVALHGVHVGTNFRCGRGGLGTEHAIREWGERRGVAVCVHGLLQCRGAAVSSTRVRAELAQGHVEEAARLLGRPHLVRGTVEHGRGEGTTLGFPTANVRVEAGTCMPAEGVYAGVVAAGGTAWPAAINVGAPRSFTSERDGAFLEANLLGFSGSLYGREVAVAFLSWLRAPRTFPSLDELERVVLSNIEWVRTHLGDEGVEVTA